MKKYIKINETALVVIILLFVTIPLFTVNQNKKNAEEILRKEQARVLAEKNALEDFIRKFEEHEYIQGRLDVIAQKYKVSPLDREIVDEYVYLLISTGKNEQAYTVVDKYFKETPKKDYWDDINLWIDYTLASILTNRCTESVVGAWHIATKTASESEQYNFAESIIYRALNKEDCIEK